MCHNVIVLFVIRQAGHQDLADRLVEIQYELTDRLAFYLCGRKPGESERDHDENWCFDIRRADADEASL